MTSVGGPGQLWGRAGPGMRPAARAPAGRSARTEGESVRGTVGRRREKDRIKGEEEASGHVLNCTYVL